MLERSSLQRQIAQKVSIAFLLGAIVWVGLLVAKSGEVRSAAINTEHHIVLGPLVLNTVAKKPTLGGGTSFGITFEQGLIWYVALCVIAGVAAGIATNIYVQKRRAGSS